LKLGEVVEGIGSIQLAGVDQPHERNFGRTEGQVIGLGVIASNVFARLGGCWWPIEITSLWTQKLALAFPTGWTMDALHKLMNFGASPVSVLPHVCVTAVAALGAGYVLSRKFRFQ